MFARHVPGAAAPPRRDAAARERIEQLSKREQKILGEIAKGLNNREIADGLFISEKTVRNHITSIFDKLGVSSRAQAIVMAKEAGSVAADLGHMSRRTPAKIGADGLMSASARCLIVRPMNLDDPRLRPLRQVPAQLAEGQLGHRRRRDPLPAARHCEQVPAGFAVAGHAAVVPESRHSSAC